MNKLYSTFHKGFIAAATIGFMAISAPAQAVPVVVDFSFGSGELTGTILGLDDEILTAQAATSVVVFSTLFGSASPLEFAPPSGSNEFTFIAGTLTRINFNDTIGDFTFDLFRSNIFAPFVQVTDSGNATVTDLFGNLVTTQQPPLNAVPLPPAGVLFGSGLVVLAAMRRRAKTLKAV